MCLKHPRCLLFVAVPMRFRDKGCVSCLILNLGTRFPWVQFGKRAPFLWEKVLLEVLLIKVV